MHHCCSFPISVPQGPWSGGASHEIDGALDEASHGFAVAARDEDDSSPLSFSELVEPTLDGDQIEEGEAQVVAFPVQTITDTPQPPLPTDELTARADGDAKAALPIRFAGRESTSLPGLASVSKTQTPQPASPDVGLAAQRNLNNEAPSQWLPAMYLPFADAKRPDTSDAVLPDQATVRPRLGWTPFQQGQLVKPESADIPAHELPRSHAAPQAMPVELTGEPTAGLSHLILSARVAPRPVVRLNEAPSAEHSPTLESSETVTAEEPVEPARGWVRPPAIPAPALARWVAQEPQFATQSALPPQSPPGFVRLTSMVPAAGESSQLTAPIEGEPLMTSTGFPSGIWPAAGESVGSFAASAVDAPDWTAPQASAPIRPDVPMAQPSMFTARHVIQQVVEHWAMENVSVQRLDQREFVVQIEPQELGRLHIVVGTEGDGIKARIIASEAAAGLLLNREKPHLIQALREQGLEFTDVDISHRDPRERDAKPFEIADRWWGHLARNQPAPAETTPTTRLVSSLRRGDSAVDLVA